MEIVIVWFVGLLTVMVFVSVWPDVPLYVRVVGRFKGFAVVDMLVRVRVRAKINMIINAVFCILSLFFILLSALYEAKVYIL